MMQVLQAAPKARLRLSAKSPCPSLGVRLMELLEAVGIIPEHLSHSGTNSLHTLAAAASELQLRDTSDTGFAVRLAELSIRESEMKASIVRDKGLLRQTRIDHSHPNLTSSKHRLRLADALQAKAGRWRRELEALKATTSQRLGDVGRVLEAARGSEKENRPALQNLQAATETYKQKQESYGLRAEHYNRQLRANGYTPEVMMGPGAAVMPTLAPLCCSEAPESAQILH